MNVPVEVDFASRGDLYRELFDGALIGIYVSTPDGRLVASNAAFARLLGFASVADAVGTNMSALYTEAVSRDASVRQVRATGRLEQHRERLRRRDGNSIDVIETVVGAFGPGGALTELRGCLVDVTASVAAALALEERVVQSEKIAGMGRLVGGIAHDFNNLLTAILGYAELLFASHGLDDRGRADIEEIQQAAQRAAALTQQLLACSRKQVS